MLAQERQSMIQDLLRRDSAVSVSDLCARFNVSVETVRKDLMFLEKNGLLTRVHGGAVPVEGMRSYINLSNRNEMNSAGKRELSLCAVDHIHEGEIIAIDSGSTASYFAEVVKDRFDTLTVVTYSLDVLQILNENQNIRVILCGGDYLPAERAFCGYFALHMLSQIHAHKAFVCPSALSLKQGFSDFQTDLFPLQKALIDHADQVFVLADSSKYEKYGLLKIDDMRSDYTYITDSHLSDELYRLYTENGLNLITP